MFFFFLFYQSIFFSHFQIFRQLELPAELQRIEDLREIVKEQRYKFLTSITNSTDVRRLDNLDEFVSKELEKYEEVFELI